MSDRVRVSVVVPTHNYAHFLPVALDSVLAQTYRDWECIIVDDGSTDDTAAVADVYVRRDPRFRYIHQANRGLAGARNTGVRNARGDGIQFLDADDRLLSPKPRTSSRIRNATSFTATSGSFAARGRRS